MKTYTLKSVIRRGSMLAAAFVIAGASLVPFATSASADALNPLTDRSLTLSSSSPGWDYKDGSGNALYAPPNSGANGLKTGNTFAFKVSTNSALDTDDPADGPDNPVKAMTFQYCTTSAGFCQAPGNTASQNGGTPRANNEAALNAHTSDLEIVTDNPTELSTLVGTVDTTTGNVTSIPTTQNYVVYYKSGGTWVQSTGWVMTTDNVETPANDPDLPDGVTLVPTGKDNQINLVKTAGEGFAAGTEVKVVFFGTEDNYITNPGAGAFFVKINTFNNTDLAANHIIDGGVTVANVMNQSIQITTKVLETMDFSVGTVDPYTLEALADAGDGEDETSQLYAATGRTTHSVCESILTSMNPSDPNATPNVLQLGNPTGEFSLSTSHTYSTHSYWRLSSNSSAGATIYYSGNTLSNTVNDKIEAIGETAEAPKIGEEQFGLALDNGTAPQYLVDYAAERDTTDGVYENGADNLAAGIVAGTGVHSSVTAAGVSNLLANASYHAAGPQLYPLAPTDEYGSGTGPVNAEYGSIANTKFAFSEDSQQIPVAIAEESDQVVDCVTGKMRYIANIAATTPAGIYTTKINYIAAPQY